MSKRGCSQSELPKRRRSLRLGVEDRRFLEQVHLPRAEQLPDAERTAQQTIEEPRAQGGVRLTTILEGKVEVQDIMGEESDSYVACDIVVGESGCFDPIFHQLAGKNVRVTIEVLPTGVPPT